MPPNIRVAVFTSRLHFATEAGLSVDGYHLDAFVELEMRRILAPRTHRSSSEKDIK